MITHSKLNDIAPGKKFEFLLYNDDHLQQLEELSCYKLPEMKRIAIGHGGHNIKSLKRFLKNSFPAKCKLLKLSGRVGHETTNIAEIIDVITKCLPKVYKEIYLGQFKMNSEQFGKLVKASRNAEILHFVGCIIESDTKIKLGDQTSYQTKEINFWGTGATNRSNWNANNDRINNIVEAICSSNLTKSVKNIHFYGCEYEIDKIRNLFMEGFSASIKIDDEKLSALYE